MLVACFTAVVTHRVTESGEPIRPSISGYEITYLLVRFERGGRSLRELVCPSG